MRGFLKGHARLRRPVRGVRGRQFPLITKALQLCGQPESPPISQHNFLASISPLGWRISIVGFSYFFLFANSFQISEITGQPPSGAFGGVSSR